MRKPLTGQLSIRIVALKDADHVATGRFSRGPETFVAVKVEDNVVARTKVTRTDKWEAELHNLSVDKANEVELCVYDKTGEQPLPIGFLWIRLSDIAEELRRKKIEAEINNSGWVAADRMGSGSAPSQVNTHGSYGAPPNSPGAMSGSAGAAMGGANPSLPPQPIEAWFNLEPTGQIQLSLSFVKQSKDRRPFDLGLNRKGAIRQRKELVHEMYGHKFVSQQFYNIMRCALCGDFLKYSAGMQCEDCKYTCHTKCYTSVVTKCISKSNAETDPEEEKINHRIPHRFEKFSNVGANWCCHCGYMLPFGKKNCRKCTECHLTAHSQCAHLVPDFCGISMAVANVILENMRSGKAKQDMLKGSRSSHTTTLSGKTLRPQTTESSNVSQPGSRASYGSTSPDALHQRTQSYGGVSVTSQEAADAAKATYGAQQHRPPQDRTSSSSSAASAAAAAAMQGSPSPQRGAYERSSTDYTAGRGSGGYGAPQDKPGYAAHERQQQQPSYNPAAYANVSNVGGYPPQQQQIPQQQQYGQQPYGAPIQPPQVHVEAPKHQPQAQQVTIPQHRKPVTPGPEPSGGRRIGLDHFNFLAVLGKGNFGKVMLAETKASKKLYAIKVLKKEFIIENDEVESTRSEKRVFLIANKERHPFLLNLHACFQTETRVYFVMEYISGGDLMLHIQRGQFGTKRAQFYAAEVCLALKYFHENGVIYRDLKLDNILLTMDGHIKIADYGLCKEEMWYQSTTSTFCGTPEFMAPEVCSFACCPYRNKTNNLSDSA